MSKSNNYRSPRVFTICVMALAFAGAIFSTPGYCEPAKPQLANRKTEVVHVYLLRGLFNVFSTGMDELYAKLRRRGIDATVHSHLEWEFLANEAIRDYKRGRVGKIVVMGHSAGAVNAIDMANKIGNAGVPVSLVVSLDPAFKTTVTSSNVRWVVNLYMPNGIGEKVYNKVGYGGVIENIDLRMNPINHVTLDKSDSIQDRAIEYALKVKKNDGPPAPAKIPAAAARTGIGNLGEMAPPISIYRARAPNLIQ